MGDSKIPSKQGTPSALQPAAARATGLATAVAAVTPFAAAVSSAHSAGRGREKGEAAIRLSRMPQARSSAVNAAAAQDQARAVSQDAATAAASLSSSSSSSVLLSAGVFEPHMFVFPCGHIHAPYTEACFDELVQRARLWPIPAVVVAQEYALCEGVTCSACKQRCLSLVVGYVYSARHAGSTAAAAEATTLCVSAAPSPSSMMHSRSIHASLSADTAAGAHLTQARPLCIMVPCGHISGVLPSSHELLRSLQVNPNQPLQVGERQNFRTLHCKVCQAEVTQMIGCVDWNKTLNSASAGSN